MTQRVLLNNVEHGDVRVAMTPAPDLLVANRLRVFPTEWQAIQREYPILVGQDADGRPEAFALLGLDRDENLFLEGGRWQARTLPALARRGPFSIGLHPREGAPDEPMIYLDLDDPRVGAEDGQRLFLPQGGNAPLLDQVADTLQSIHLGHQVQERLFAALQEADLLEPVRLEIMLDETLRYDLVDFQTVGVERLAALDGAALERLHQQGFLASAFHLAQSLDNVPALVERKNRRRR
jgi:hypothetical protein